jgi:hypothetical protein
MPVTAGIIRDPNGSTVIALIPMTAQFCGPAYFDGPHGPKMAKRHRVGFPISGPKSPKDVGHF